MKQPSSAFTVRPQAQTLNQPRLNAKFSISQYPVPSAAPAYIEKSAEIQGRVGNITGYGMFPSGGLQVQNGYGLGQLRINVIGDKGSVTVHLKMEKEPGAAWEIKETVLEGS